MARELVRGIYAQLATNKDFGFNSQIQRAAISIMNNIAEGFDRSKNSKDNKQLLSFLNISYGSCGEVKSMLYAAEDLGYIEADEAKLMRNCCTDISFKIESFMQKLREYDSNTKSPTAKLTNTKSTTAKLNNSEAQQQRSSLTAKLNNSEAQQQRSSLTAKLTNTKSTTAKLNNSEAH